MTGSEWLLAYGSHIITYAGCKARAVFTLDNVMMNSRCSFMWKPLLLM